jgi:hypothetical protein
MVKNGSPARELSLRARDDLLAPVSGFEGHMSNHGVQMRKIVLEEARAKGAPAGPGVHAYEFVAPLDEAGFINLEAWKWSAP